MSSKLSCSVCKQRLFQTGQKNASTCKSIANYFFAGSQRYIGYKCIQCDDFKLCHKCERIAPEYHPATHAFVAFDLAHALRGFDFPNATKDTENKPVMQHEPCSNCRKMIIGVMFVCTHCKELRYCIQCYHDKAHEHQFDHAFIKLRSLFGIWNEIAWEAEDTNVRGAHAPDSLVRSIKNTPVAIEEKEVSNGQPAQRSSFSARLQSLNSSGTFKKSVSGSLSARISFFERGNELSDQVVTSEPGNTAEKKTEEGADLYSLGSNYEEYPAAPAAKPSSPTKQLNAQVDNAGYVVGTSYGQEESNTNVSERYSEGLETQTAYSNDGYMNSAESPYLDQPLVTSDDKSSVYATLDLNQYIASYADDIDYESDNDVDKEKKEDTQVESSNNTNGTYINTAEELEDSSDSEEEKKSNGGYTETVEGYRDPETAYCDIDDDNESSSEQSLEEKDEPKKEVANPVTTASIGAKGELEIMNSTRPLHPLMEKILAFPVHNWEDFLMDIYTKSDTIPNKLELLDHLYYFQGVIREFVGYAEMIARVIIDEAYLPTEEKSIKPVDVGGIAGGQKYLFKGIFFKFAIDSMGIYGGDVNAAKAANREILGLKAYFWARVPDLRVPFTVLVDYRGFRIIATPCLPIGKGTLQYGSDDGGVTVLKENKILNEKMKLAAKAANLKGHKVGVKIPRKIYGPGDIEGHKGLDGRYYVIDTARVMPPFPPETTFHVFKIPRDADYTTDGQWTKMSPIQIIDVRIKGWRTELRDLFVEIKENPDIELKETLFPRGSIIYIDKEHLTNPTLNRRATSMTQVPIYGDPIVVNTSAVRGRQLYNLIRYEMLLQWKEPLSSDVFTRFQVDDEDKAKDEENLREVETYLREKLVPHFAERLLNEEVKVFDGPSLTWELHSAGINIRFLGLLRPYLKDNLKYSSLVFAEMISRIAKVFLRTTIRRIKSISVTGLSVNTLIAYLNLVFGNSTGSMYFWKHLIKPLVITRFGDVLTPEELDPHYDLRDSVTSRYELFTTLSNQIGAVFKSDVLEKFKANPKLFEKVNPFKSDDFVELRSIARSCVDSCLATMIKNLTEYIENQKNNIPNSDRNPLLPQYVAIKTK